MYLTNNQHVLFHGCIPVDEKGQLLAFELDQSYRGKRTAGLFEKQITESAKDLTAKEDLATDLIWYAWRGHFRLYSARVKWRLLNVIFSQSLIRTSRKAILIITCEMKSGSVKNFSRIRHKRRRVSNH